jgi:phenylacetate-CoA ligase
MVTRRVWRAAKPSRPAAGAPPNFGFRSQINPEPVQTRRWGNNLVPVPHSGADKRRAICRRNFLVYIAGVLATSEIIREAAQANRVAELLPQWCAVPLYRDALRSPARSLAELPVITKRELRAGFPQNFLAEPRSLDALLAAQLIELEHTSGTSAERLPVVFRRGWWNEQEERALRLNKFVNQVLDEHPQTRRATLTPPACNGLTCPTVWMSPAQRTLGNSLFVNLARIPFVLSEAELQRMADEITAWQPQFLDLDPVHGAWFALFCERRGIRFPSVRFVICSYEFVSVVHRRILQRVFGVPVFNLYGSTETGHLLMENEAGEMKPSYDTALLEVVDAGAANIGTLLVTTLSNDYMPLLRYRIGDLMQRHECSYGTDYTVHGRIRDALVAADGTRVTTWQVDQCFGSVAGMVHYQLRQTTPTEFQLRYIPEGADLGREHLSMLAVKLDSLLGASVSFESVPTLLPEASGKFRLTSRVQGNARPSRAPLGD